MGRTALVNAFIEAWACSSRHKRKPARLVSDHSYSSLELDSCTCFNHDNTSCLDLDIDVYIKVRELTFAQAFVK